uniref:Uncharacterized protein n=1 Tax=Ixodes ricinus TaxID=34613 RepID=A0A147BVA1_IXORI
MRFLSLLRSSLIPSWSRMSMGDSGGVAPRLGTVWGSSFTCPSPPPRECSDDEGKMKLSLEVEAPESEASAADSAVSDGPPAVWCSWANASTKPRAYCSCSSVAVLVNRYCVVGVGVVVTSPLCAMMSRSSSGDASWSMFRSGDVSRLEKRAAFRSGRPALFKSRVMLRLRELRSSLRTSCGCCCCGWCCCCWCCCGCVVGWACCDPAASLLPPRMSS